MAAPSVAPAPSVVAAPSVAPARSITDISELYNNWEEWYSYVTADGPLPAYLAPQTAFWRWILTRFRAVPETHAVALRWWFDKVATYADQRALYEHSLTTKDTTSPSYMALRGTIHRDIIDSDQLVAYRIFNPDTKAVEFFCRRTGLDEGFSPCASNIAARIDKGLGNTPVRFPAETGVLFGFLTPKAGGVVFKSLDTTKPIRSVTAGAECGNVSNLDEHRPRIRLLQAATVGTDLAAMMIPDKDAEWSEVEGGAAILSPAHLRDMKHGALCLYMEFLTRLYDVRKLKTQRWFLSAVETMYAGLRSR